MCNSHKLQARDAASKSSHLKNQPSWRKIEAWAMSAASCAWCRSRITPNSQGLRSHMVSILSGLIARKAGPAISYGLGQGATLVAALWGVFMWKELKNSSRGTNGLIAAMFFFFIVGLGLLIYAGK